MEQTVISFELLLNRIVLIKDLVMAMSTALFEALSVEIDLSMLTGVPTVLSLLDIMLGGGFAIYVSVRLISWIAEQVLPG